MSTLAETPFKQTLGEILVSVAATLFLQQLKRFGIAEKEITDLCQTPRYGYTASASVTPCGPRFVRITDVKGGSIDWDRVPYCECADPSAYRLETGDILEAWPKSPKSASKVQKIALSHIRFLSPKPVRSGFSAASLVARSGSVGKSFIVSNVPKTAVFASYMIRLRVRQETLPAYLYWCLQSQQFWRQIVEVSRGSAMENINGRMLAALRFPHPEKSLQAAIVRFLEDFKDRLAGSRKDLPQLPAPLSEQRRIVARIEELAGQIEEARALRKQADGESLALVGARAGDLFAGIPNRYQVQDVADVRGGIQKSPYRMPGANPVRYLTVAHVQRNRVLTGDPRYFEVTQAELERWRLLSGDVLIIEGNGSAEQIGRTALFRGEIQDCVHQNHVIRIRPCTSRLSSEFLNGFLNSPAGQDAVQAQSRTTSGLRTLSVGRIKQIRVPVPSLPDQRRIVAKLDTLQAEVDSLKRLQAETGAELDALLPSILDKAFKGEL